MATARSRAISYATLLSACWLEDNSGHVCLEAGWDKFPAFDWRMTAAIFL